MSVEILKDFTSKPVPTRLFTPQGIAAWNSQQEKIAEAGRALYELAEKEPIHILKLVEALPYDERIVKEAMWCLLDNKHVKVTDTFHVIPL